MLGIENVAVAAFRFVYKRKRPRPLGARRPWIALFPRYRAKVELPETLLASTDPDQALEARLADLGFHFDAWTRERIRFTRGKAWGDFSVRLIKLELSLPRPLERSTWVQLEVASVCFFDTGDLWALCRQVIQRLEADEGPGSGGGGLEAGKPGRGVGGPSEAEGRAGGQGQGNRETGPVEDESASGTTVTDAVRTGRENR